MRYLTVKEVIEAGHTPHLVYDGNAYSFKHHDTGAIIGHNSLSYEAAILMIDLDQVETAPLHRVM